MSSVIYINNDIKAKIKFDIINSNLNKNFIFETNNIEFEKNKSKFIYELNYKSINFFNTIKDNIKQDKYNFFKFNEFNKFIKYKNNNEIYKKSLIEDSIENFEKMKEKNEFEFFYLLLLMKELNSNFKFSFEELKLKKFIFQKDNEIENIEDYKNYLLNNNFKNNDNNYIIIKFIFLWNYFKKEFIDEFIKENFENNFNIFFDNIDKDYISKLKKDEKIINLNKILYKCDIDKLNQLLKLFYNINDQITFIINENEFNFI
jgi:hypothetical protein